MSGAFSPPHLLVIGIGVLVLFGKGQVSSKMGEVGKGITAFRKGLEEGRREVETSPLILSSDVAGPSAAGDVRPQVTGG